MELEYGIRDISSGEDEKMREEEEIKEWEKLKKELEEMKKEEEEVDDDNDSDDENDDDDDDDEELEEKEERADPYDLIREMVREKREKAIRKRTFDGKTKSHDIGNRANGKIEEAQDTKSYKQGIIDDWDSETDLSFDRDDYDERGLYVAPSFDPDREAFGKYAEHYLALCKSRGYDFNTVKLPSNMTWSHHTWIRPYPEDKYKDIERVLKDHAIPIINNRTGKDLEVLRVTAVNHWAVYTGFNFFVTFEARDKNNTTDKDKRIYQTRLFLTYPDTFHRRSCRLLNRAGIAGPVHAFREKPN